MSATSISTSAIPDIGASVQQVFGSGRSHGRSRRSRAERRVQRIRMLMSISLAMALGAVSLVWFSAGSASLVPAEARSAEEVQVLRADGTDGALVMSRAKPALIEHMVVPGDTLWALAISVGGDGDPRAYIDRVQKLNGLPTASLPVGLVVLLPSNG